MIGLEHWRWISQIECPRTESCFGKSGENRGGGQMDSFGTGCGGPDEIVLGMASSRDSSELVGSNGNTTILKREYDDEDDFVDVNGPFLCIKTEAEEDDAPTVISDTGDPTRIFEVRNMDDESTVTDTGIANEELLVVWQEQQGRDSIGDDNRRSIWMRKDPQCEVWSCKMLATYGHSTGPSRCAQHREAWMVMFDHCVVAGCLKFGVVFSLEDEHVRCETHAAEAGCRRSIHRLQSRPLEHLVDDNSVGPAGLGLGLGLGDDCRVHEGSRSARQSQLIVGESLGRTAETSDHSSRGQEVQEELAETSWAVAASNGCHPEVEISNGPTSNSIEDEICRLKEEYEDLRQKMAKIEIDLARLQGLKFCDPQKNDAPVKMSPKVIAHISSAAKAVVTNGGSNNGASTLVGKFSLDGYNWRKYGEISLPGMGGLPHPRVFYGCANIGCIARKIEERTEEGHVKYFYEGVHNHPQPGKNFAGPVLVPHWKRRRRHHNGCAD